MAITDFIMDATVTTTASDGAPKARSRPSVPPRNHHGGAVVGLGIAVLLAVLGIPRLVAALLALDAQAVLWQVHAGTAVPPAVLADASAGLDKAGRWSAEGEGETDRGLLLLHQAVALPPGPERTGLLDQATTATTAGLAAAPGQPGPWARLAWLREQGDNPAGAVRALRLSWLSGGFDPGLMASRLELALRLLPAMDPETRSLLRRQIRLTWAVAPEFVAGLSGHDGAAPVIREALAELSEDAGGRWLQLQGRRP